MNVMGKVRSIILIEENSIFWCVNLATKLCLFYSLSAWILSVLEVNCGMLGFFVLPMETDNFGIILE